MPDHPPPDRSPQEISRVVDAALELDSAERNEFLDRECGSDTELRRAVERILDFDPRGAGGPDPAAANEFWEGLDDGKSLVGQRVGPYRLTRVLAHGGMGVVFAAERQGEFHQEVAIKWVRAGHFDQQARQRLEFERQALARLEHPNIARLYDGGTSADGLPYLVMEYVKGSPIDEYCNRLRLSVRQRLQLLVPVLEAVDYAHSHLLVHCDIKPSNILVTDDGVPKLIDFGISKLLGQADPHKTALTVTGFRPMTVSHASPEQVMAGPISVASDVYSLGVLTNVLLCGRLPYSVPMGNQLLLARAIIEQEPERPSKQVSTGASDTSDPVWKHARSCGTRPKELARQLRGDLDAIVLQAIRKEPSHRYRSVKDLAADLDAHLESRPVSARSGTWRYRAARLLRRLVWPADPQRRRERWTWSALVALLLVGAAIGLYALRPPDPCLGAEQRLAGVWDDAQKSAVEEVFLASGLPFAEDTWSRVETGLDRRAADWVETRTEVCRDTHARGELSPRLLDLAQLCLDGRLEELRALVEYFREADQRVVIGAIEAAGMLRDLEECRDPAGLATRTVPPSDPEIRQRLATARAVVETQDLRFRLRLAVDFGALKQAESDLRELGDAALQSRALYVLGAAQSDANAGPAGSIELLEDALRAAIAGGDLPQQIRIYSALIKSLAFTQNDFDRARFWYSFAQASLESLGPGHFDLRHNIASAAGLMEWEAGNYFESKELRLKALEYAERSGDPIRRMRSLGALGIYGESRYLRQALALTEQRLGPDHVMLAQPMVNYAGLLAYRGRYSEALALTRRGRDLLLETHGSSYPQLTFPQTMIGQILLATDDLDGAIETLEQAVESHQAAGRDPRALVLGSALTSLADAKTKAGRLEEAALHLQQAAEALQRLPPSHEIRVEWAKAKGDFSWSLGIIVDALDLYRSSIAFLEKGYGTPLSEQTGHLATTHLFSLARALYYAGQLTESEKHLEGALRASAKVEPNSTTAGIRYYLARCLWDTDRTRAQKLIDEARAELSTDLPYQQRLLAEIDEWVANEADG